jgi:adenylate kinase
MQAKSFVEKGQLVPDNVMIHLVFARLQEPDVLEKGYVLEGFPRTREQALAMQRKGIFPDHLSTFFIFFKKKLQFLLQFYTLNIL